MEYYSLADTVESDHRSPADPRSRFKITSSFKGLDHEGKEKDIFRINAENLNKSWSLSDSTAEQQEAVTSLEIHPFNSR